MKHSEMSPLEIEFHSEMIKVSDEAKKQKYYPTYFLQMVFELGGVKAAKQLLGKREVQPGLMKLFELDLLSTSMEAFVIQERFHTLFTDEEVQEARRRLDELHYFKKKSKSGL